MSKKTLAYGEGYTAGQKDAFVESNPYSESEQSEQHGDWLSGYADGLIDKEHDTNQDSEEDDEDFTDDHDMEYDDEEGEDDLGAAFEEIEDEDLHEDEM